MSSKPEEVEGKLGEIDGETDRSSDNGNEKWRSLVTMN